MIYLNGQIYLKGAVSGEKLVMVKLRSRGDKVEKEDKEKRKKTRKALDHNISVQDFFFEDDFIF